MHKKKQRKAEKTSDKRAMGSSIASRWRELSGENNWDGLLQPLDPDLRRYIIHYGQRTAAVGDLFNSKTDEPDASKEEFFSKACLVKGNPYEYDVTHFLYAGSDDVEPSWFRYMAVANDEGKCALGRRDILVSWRGTSSISEWLNDFNFIIQISTSGLFLTAKEHGATVHRGFHCLYTGTRRDSTHCKTSVREQVLGAVKELVNKYMDDEVSITVSGFSLGAALATLTAIDIVANGYDKSSMVMVYTYGGPRVGNSGLACLFDTLGDQLHLLRMKNQRDLVPSLPPEVFSYNDFGKILIINTHESKYLKWKGPFGLYATFSDKDEDVPKRKRTRKNIYSLNEDLDEDEHEPKRKRTRKDTCSLNEDLDEDEHESKRNRIRGGIPEYYSCHNMDVYEHGVAIKDIKNNTPIDKLDHDLSLVNKHLDRVKNEYKIPPNWWTGENRQKMVQLENGLWVVKS